MTSRFDYTDHAPGAYAAIDGLDRWISRCSLEGPLIDLVRLGASQLNGCAYCILSITARLVPEYPLEEVS